jgi:hypothetical protein
MVMYPNCKICKKKVCEDWTIEHKKFKKEYCTCKWRKYFMRLYKYFLTYDRYEDEDIEYILAVEKNKERTNI